jgi:hypothetical protein
MPEDEEKGANANQQGPDLETTTFDQGERTIHNDQHGRVIFESAALVGDGEDDAFWWLFVGVGHAQEYAIPLIVGAVMAMTLANADWGTYEYYFTSDRCDEAEKAAYALAHPGGDVCHSDRWHVLDAPIFGHSLTLHFIANDLVMCFHFGLAMKEVTEVCQCLCLSLRLSHRMSLLFSISVFVSLSASVCLSTSLNLCLCLSQFSYSFSILSLSATKEVTE